MRYVSVWEEWTVYQQLWIVYIYHSKRETKRGLIQDIRNVKQSNACLSFWISVMLIAFFILSSSCCYGNIGILECLGKIMSHQKTAFCLCRPSFTCPFSSLLLEFSCTNLFAKLNIQSLFSLSPMVQRPWHKLPLTWAWQVEHTKKTSPSDAQRWPDVGRQLTIGLVCPGL